MSSQRNRTMFTPIVLLALAGCAAGNETAPAAWEPQQVVDLGALVTEDLTEQIWGTRYVEQRGFDQPNVFDITRTDLYDGVVTLQNGYYTLFNHGGPHVDGPNHIGLEGGIDSFPVESFSGPLKVIDVRHFGQGRTVTVDAFEGKDIRPGDVVLIYTGYTPPEPDSLPGGITLTWEAAEFLATLPIRAFGTDARSVASLQDRDPRETNSDGRSLLVRAAPVHHAFLSRGIPIYEQLFNVAALLDRGDMFFTGVPVNIRNGDGMVVRPVVFVY